MTLIYFYRKDLSNFLILISKEVNKILLWTCKVIKTIFKKSLENNQLFEINNNNAFFNKIWSLNMKIKAINRVSLTKT